MQRMRVNVFFALVLMAIFSGAVSPLGKIALEAFGPLTLALFRFVVALLVCIPFIRISTDEFTRMKRHWRATLRVGFVAALNPIIFFLGLKFTAASVTPMIYAIVPVLTALYFFFVQKRKLSPRTWLGILVGLTGVAIVVVLPLVSETQGITLLGNLIILAAVVAFTAFGLLSKKYQDTYNFSAQSITLSFIVVTTILSIPLAFFEVLASPSTYLVDISLRHWIAVALMGIFSTTIVYLMYQRIIKNVNELAASLFHFIQPVVVPIMAVILLSEKISIELVIGGVLAVVGAWLASQRSPSHDM